MNPTNFEPMLPSNLSSKKFKPRRVSKLFLPVTDVGGIAEERKATTLILICWTHIPMALALIGLGAYMESPIVLALTFAALISFVAPLPFAYFGKHRFGRAVFILNVNVVAVTISCFMSPEIGGYLYFYNTLSVPMLLFDSTEKKSLVRSYLLSFAMLGLMVLYRYFIGFHFDLSAEHTRLMFIGNFSATFLFLLGVLGSIHLTYVKYERRLKGSIVKLEHEIDENLRHQKTIDEQRAVIIEKSRLSKLGEMAASVAHEINNPLSVMDMQMRQLDRASRKIADFETKLELETALSRLKTNIKRISSVVRSFKNLSRDAEKDPFVEASLGDILSESVQLVTERFRVAGIKLQKNFEVESVKLVCRPIQLEQVIVNLLNNAYDAVSGRSGGEVKIESIESDGQITIAVVDNGPGVPEELKDKIMTPFFTTKAVGLGTGIGLSIAKQIAQEHDGSVTYLREGGKTRFELTLPVTVEKMKKAS